MGNMLLSALLTPEQLEQARTLFALTVAPRVVLLELALLREAIALSGPAGIAARYLAPEERERFLAFTYEKRRAEWLGGRLTAKAAAQGFGPLPSGEVEWQRWRIRQNPQGKPFIHSAPPLRGRDPAISISHSGGLAVAMAVDSTACGIDLQKITPALERVRERFATGEELALIGQAPGLERCSSLARLALLWTAKEAYRKAKERTPLLGFLEMRLRGIEASGGPGFILKFAGPKGEITGPQAYVSLHPGFACALTVLT